MRVLIGVAVWLAMATVSAAQCDVPSYNRFYGTPKGLTETDAFVGKFDYAETATEPLPAFLSIDFTNDWKAYIEAVLNYAYQGNLGSGDDVAKDFDIAANTVRSWYHTLWMHPGSAGREFVHGLTRERGTDREQLKNGLPTRFQTWAIGFYNAFGGEVLARVFKEPCNPDASNVLFPVGTVSFKLLFTSATEADLPYLAGAPVWKVDVDRAREVAGVEPAPPSDMRLLQVDVAVRDNRAAKSGWVFGTFVYNNEVEAESPWRRLLPVGLSWGNDSGLLPGGALAENVVDAGLHGTLFGWVGRKELGWAGRMNGPLDNQISSCVSCHSTAQFPRSDDFGNLPSGPVDLGDGAAVAERLAQYFQDIAPGELFDPLTTFFDSDVMVDALPMDYSLQLQSALERFCFAVDVKDPPMTSDTVPPACDEEARIARPMSVEPALDAEISRRRLEAIDWERYTEPVR